jgi:predicted phosphoribosyltransferase
MKPQYPMILFASGGAQVIATSDEQVVLIWDGVAVGHFKTPVAAIRYLNAEFEPI